LKIRHDAVALSSLLFTLGLLIPMPSMLGNAWTVRQMRLVIAGGFGLWNYFAPIGFTSLAIIVIGLIVTWSGYIKGVRWTWFVMFMIAWGWACPVLVLPEFHWRNMLPISQWPQWPPLILTGVGPQLGFPESVVAFLLMVLALALPAKTFLVGNHGAPEG
jgi:hypothetical protein